MIKIQIYIANFNLGVRKISGRHTRTLSGLTPPLSIIAARHRLGDLATRRPEMSAPMVVGFVIVRSESQGGEHESGFTQHVSSVLGRNARDAANATP